MPDIITLDMDTPSIQYLCKKDKRLAKVIRMVGPISYVPYEEDPYGFLVHEIIEQMLSVKAGQKIFTRLEILCNGHISPSVIRNLSDEEIKSIGTSASKVKSIRLLTEAIEMEKINLHELIELNDLEVTNKLTSIHGIGSWTAKMFLIFCLNRQDILPYEDVAFLQAYKWVYKTEDCNVTSVKKRCNKWKPYSAIAARYMYRALDTGLTKNEFHLFK